MRRYVLTGPQFRSLAEGGGSPDAIALLTEAQLSARRLRLLAVAERWDSLPVTLRDALHLVMETEKVSPAAGLELLRYPFLRAWFGSVVPVLGGRAAEQLGSLAAATAVCAGVPFELTIDCSGADLHLPRVGTATDVGPASVPVRFDGTTLTVGSALKLPVPADESRPGWRPVHHVRLAGHSLEIIDGDALRDRFPVAPLDPLPSAALDRLDHLVREAWQLLEDEQPAHAAGMRIALRALVPLRTPEDAAQVSASVRGCFGAIGMSIPDDPMTLAELLVHEFQHEKLGALLDLTDLSPGDGSARYHAPWRPDPRPAHALVQGVYAFTGVAGFWRACRSRTDDAGTRYFTWRDHVGYALGQLLDGGELSSEGDRFFRGLDGTLATWRSEEATPSAIRLSTIATQVSWRLAHYRPRDADVDALVRAWSAARTRPAYGPPVVGAGMPPAELAGLLERRAAGDGTGYADATEAERAILRGESAVALRLLPSPVGDREWAAAAVALCTPTGDRAIAGRRPDLLRAVFERLDAEPRRPGLSTLHRWLSDEP
ncbi:aKG-HExxH-type peptide beta-hydroxylase [Actinoplanes sp. NPDC048796]|uniref:aKG-HExxH-type peptide beta-hydroxylase n=1 Tax=unclassified Actinoplanes TaxID=2626549 RepID=UPI0033FF2400